MKRALSFSLAVAALALQCRAAAPPAPTPDQVPISPEAAKILLDSEQKMNPGKTGSFCKLEQTFKKKNPYKSTGQYSVAQVLAIRDGEPKPLHVDPPHVTKFQTGNPPPSTWTKKQVTQRFEAQEKIDPKLNDPKLKRCMDRLQNLCQKDVQFDKITWFTTEQVRYAETLPKVVTPEQDARFDALDSVTPDLRKPPQGPRWPRIRRDWSDVLYDEDQSQPQNGKPKVLSDLQGALFSYVRDGKANTDTWNANAALILPFTWGPKEKFDKIWNFAVAPSVTYNRVSTNGNRALDVDSLFYRMGLFADMYGQCTPSGVSATFGYDLQLRAAGVRVTDQNHRAGLNGFEVDIEPRLHYKQGFLGYQTILWPKIPVKVDKSDVSFLNAQLRVWLHMEGGDVQDVGTSWAPVKGPFFRLGPTVELKLISPAMPGFSLTTLYSYLSAVSGSTTRPSYFSTTLGYALFSDLTAEYNHKITINTKYERGGLNFTKQQVDTLTIGLGVLF